MKKATHKPVILWILQENQVTPHIIEFLKRMKSGISKIDILFAAPEQDRKALSAIAPLQPIFFNVSRIDHGNTNQNFNRKMDMIKDLEFSGGLDVWRALLLDDFGAGQIAETQIHMAPLTNVRGVILQIPTPLGSRTEEEYIFEAWVKWAHANGVFITGYELLPLYTRWKLLPSVLDGIMTINRLSFDYLSNTCEDVRGKVWQLPGYEANVFSIGAGNLWKRGLEVPYHYRMKYNIARGTTILYVPHNVAMTYEYKRLVQAIREYGDRIHLMFSIGTDQARGTHSHREIIETTCGDALKHFHSHSFHEISAPWEMVMADAVISCAHNYATMLGQSNGIPCIIKDETVPEAETAHLKIVSDDAGFAGLVNGILSDTLQVSDITSILYDIVNREHAKINVSLPG